MEATGMKGRVSVSQSLWAAGLFCIALFAIYYGTAASMVDIWSRSETFAHGFLILPISLWLIWTRREYLAPIIPKPVWWVALLLLPIGFGWLLAWLVDVAVIQQLALVAMLIVGVWSILGHKLAAVLAFPLFFLFFAVPIGEGLVMPMMEFTATSTVWMIEMTGIPVYREGLYFNLPTGNWSVVEACSGVRYIIASVTVGVLYAYLTYRSWTRRALFVLVSAIVPIFANSARAYLIVMLGHMSDMTIATGADHLVYGWVFFGFVIFILFWLGGYFREDHLDVAPEKAPLASDIEKGAGAPSWTLWATLCSTLLLVSVAPLLAREAFGTSTLIARDTVAFPAPQGIWRSVAQAPWSWSPYSKVSGQDAAYYASARDEVGVIVQFPDGTVEGTDVIGSSALFTQEDSGWRVTNREKTVIEGPNGDITVDLATVHGLAGELMVWSWYVVGATSTSNDYEAKLYETLARLSFSDSRTYRIMVVTPAKSDLANAPGQLQAFVSEYIPLLYQKLRPAVQSPN